MDCEHTNVSAGLVYDYCKDCGATRVGAREERGVTKPGAWHSCRLCRLQREMQRMQQLKLTIVPISLRQANAFIAEHHRHHKPPRGAKFALGVVDPEGELRGVVSVGRPVARAYDDGLTAEVNRSATDGCPNANSALYGAAWRVCQAMGYRKLITYTLQTEPGTSLRAAGFQVVGEVTKRNAQPAAPTLSIS